MTEVFKKIVALLDDAQIDYETDHHEPTHNSVESAKARGVELRSGAKALVLQGNKSHDHFLFVVPADLRVDNKKVKNILEERTSFAQDPFEVTGCVPGSVPPLGSVIGLKTYVDAKLAENEWIFFKAGSLTDSVKMKYEDYLRIEKPEVVDVTQ